MKAETEQVIKQAEQKNGADLAEPNKLLNKNFILLWQGQFVSRIGSQVFLFAMIVWITETYNSPSLVGLLGMTAGIPTVLLSAVGGAFADRYSRKKIVVWSDILNGIVVSALSAIFLFFPDSSSIVISALIAASLITASISSFFNPAVSAAIPDIVPKSKVPAANSMGQLSGQISQVIGQLTGTKMLLLLGAPLLTIINALTFIFSGISELFISIPQALPEKSKDVTSHLRAFKEDIMEGARYIYQNKGLYHLVLASMVMTFFSAPILVLMTFFVRDTLGVSLDYWFGIMLVAYGVGTALGYVVVGLFTFTGRSRRNSLIAFMILEAAMTVLLALCTSPYQAVVVMFLQGFMAGFFVVNITTILQLTTPTTIRGRVFGVLTTISGSTAPLGMALGGFVAQLVNNNIPLIFGTSGGIMVLLSVIISFSRPFRTFIAFKTDEEIKEERGGFYYTMKSFDATSGYKQ